MADQPITHLKTDSSRFIDRSLFCMLIHVTSQKNFLFHLHRMQKSQCILYSGTYNNEDLEGRTVCMLMCLCDEVVANQNAAAQVQYRRCSRPKNPERVQWTTELRELRHSLVLKTLMTSKDHKR